MISSPSAIDSEESVSQQLQMFDFDEGFSNEVKSNSVSSESASGNSSVSSVDPKGRPRMLFVNDNATILRVLTEALEDHFKVSVADCGTEALQMIQDKPRNYFDVMVLDINMPIMDGFELCEKIDALIKGCSLSSMLNLPMLSHRRLAHS